MLLEQFVRYELSQLEEKSFRPLGLFLKLVEVHFQSLCNTRILVLGLDLQARKVDNMFFQHFQREMLLGEWYPDSFFPSEETQWSCRFWIHVENGTFNNRNLFVALDIHDFLTLNFSVSLVKMI